MRRVSKSEIQNRKKGRVAATSVTTSPTSRDETPIDTAIATVADTPVSDSPLPVFEEVLLPLTESVETYYENAPHLQAFEHLELQSSESAAVLSSVAAELFERVLKDRSEDALALHHLAIINHGSGCQLHLQGSPTALATLEHWKRGLQSWAQLVARDSFWNQLRERWTARNSKTSGDMMLEALLRVDLANFRRHIPRYLLEMHSRIVTEYFQSDLSVSRAHMRLIRESGFPVADIDAVCQQIFSNLTSRTARLCEELKFEEAEKLVRRYLEIDPEYPPAGMAALDVCVRHCQYLGTQGKQYDKRLELVKSVEASAGSQPLRKLADEKLLVAETLRNFYCAKAQAEFDRGNDTAKVSESVRSAAMRSALSSARQAMTFEKRCGHKARDLLALICYLGAWTDLNSKNRSFQLAKELLKVGRTEFPAHPAVVAADAFLYFRLEDRAKFRETLDRAKRLNASAANAEAAQLITVLDNAAQQEGVGQNVLRLFETATASLKGQNYPAALTTLRQLEQFIPQCSPADRCAFHYLTAVALLGTGQREAARASLRAAESLLHACPELTSEIRSLSNIL